MPTLQSFCAHASQQFLMCGALIPSSVIVVCLRSHLRFLTAFLSDIAVRWTMGSIRFLSLSHTCSLYALIGNCVLNSGLWGKRAERRGESRVARPLDWINILTSIDNNTNTELIFSLHESRPLLPWCAKAVQSSRLEASDFHKVLYVGSSFWRTSQDTS